MKKSEMLPWTEVTKLIDHTQPGEVQLSEWCHSVTVKNVGDFDIIVNGATLQSGQFKAWLGEPRSLFVGKMNIRWLNTSSEPVPVTRLAEVTQIVYVNFNPNEA